MSELEQRYKVRTAAGVVPGDWWAHELPMLAGRMDAETLAGAQAKPCGLCGVWQPLGDVVAGRPAPAAPPRVRMNGQPESEPEPVLTRQLSSAQAAGVWLIIAGLVMLGATLLMETGVDGVHNLSRAHWQTLLLILSLAVLALGVFLAARRRD